jgi:hypothetical protein
MNGHRDGDVGLCHCGWEGRNVGVTKHRCRGRAKAVRTAGADQDDGVDSAVTEDGESHGSRRRLFEACRPAFMISMATPGPRSRDGSRATSLRSGTCRQSFDNPTDRSITIVQTSTLVAIGRASGEPS